MNDLTVRSLIRFNARRQNLLFFNQECIEGIQSNKRQAEN